MVTMSKETHDSDMDMLAQLGKMIQNHPVNVAVAQVINEGPVKCAFDERIERIRMHQESEAATMVAEIFHPMVKLLDTTLGAIGLGFNEE